MGEGPWFVCDGLTFVLAFCGFLALFPSGTQALLQVRDLNPIQMWGPPATIAGISLVVMLSGLAAKRIAFPTAMLLTILSVPLFYGCVDYHSAIYGMLGIGTIVAGIVVSSRIGCQKQAEVE